MTEPSPSSARGAALAFIIVTVVLDSLALGVIIPVLPKLVVEFEGGDTARAAEIFGVFGTVWALMQFVFSPVLGALSDRFGRRTVILVSNFGLGLDYVLMALAPSLGWLFVGRVISGITAASFGTAGAYIADVTPPETRARGFGMIGAGFGLGFVLGPALGGLLGGMGPRVPFWIAAVLSLANATYGFFVLPESLPPSRRAPFSWQRANPVGSLTLLRSRRQLLGLSTVMFLRNIAHDVLPSTFVLYTGYRYGWDTRTIGLTMAVMGVCGMIVSAGLVQPVVTRFGERRVLLAGLGFGTAAFAVYGLAPTGLLALAAVPLQALWSLDAPAAQGLMTRVMDPSEQGQLQGAQSSLRGIGGMIAPGLFTQTFARAIDTHGTWHVPGAPFLLAAALLGSALVLASRVTRRTVHAGR
ncbi:MAG TPA: TCR/Tet family MFS transporter [Candidatus Eisenbacteria bacterium]|nr:TCR/Tet family MFS transporter [Candidatus Eisenbacteria bacterium]